MAYVAVILDSRLSLSASGNHAPRSLVAKPVTRNRHVRFRSVAWRNHPVHDVGHLSRSSTGTAPAVAGVSQAHRTRLVRGTGNRDLVVGDIFGGLHRLCFLPRRECAASIRHAEGDGF